MIPDEAIEAAARVMHTQDLARDHARRTVWAYEGDVKDMLEAAVPHLAVEFKRELALAWATGARDGWKQSGEGWNAEYPDEGTGVCHVDLSDNPYRSSGNAN